MNARGLWMFFLLSSCFLPAQTALELGDRADKAVAVLSGEIKVGGLKQPVKVLRDRWGIAHIYAANQHDLFYAQGFVAAQDRLFQMEMWKRAGQGRLAEVLGPESIERDHYARLLSYRPVPLSGGKTAVDTAMKSEYSSYAPDTLPILGAFTDGINAYIRYLKTPASPGLPIEFQLAGFQPEPWKPEDCLSRMAAFSMTGNSVSELRDAEMLTKLGPDKAEQLLDPDPKAKLDPAAGADYSGLSSELLEGMVGGDARIEFPPRATSTGSNNWTVSGKLTSTGKPILANDPHRVIAVPSLRYIVHLVAPGWNVIGAGEPALPGVAIGHNQNIAWGLTIFPVDQQDLYIEELNPENPLEYKFHGKWQRMRTEQVIISVKGAPAASETLKFTQHGPVLWEDATRHRALALHWVGAEPGTAGYLASLSLDRATNWKEFIAALGRWKLPPENMVYADTRGNIGEQSAGLTPIRKWTGLLPVPGTGGYEWSGFVPLAQLPHTLNPADGWFATANNRTIPNDYKYSVGFEWSTFRIERIRQVIGERARNAQKIRIEDMQDLHNDIYSIPADQLIRMLPQRSDGAEQRYLEMLKDWDRRFYSPSVPAALYEVWERSVRDAVLKEIAGASAPDFPGSVNTQCAIDYLRAMPVDHRQKLLLDSLAAAGQEMVEKQGSDPALWSWGSVHTMTFRHSLDKSPGGKELFDLGPIARPGDSNTVDATGTRSTSLEQTSGASYREIFDLSDWDNSLAVNTPGQSGQPESLHYADLLPVWSAGQYFQFLYSRQQVEENATDILTLSPAFNTKVTKASARHTKSKKD